MLLVHLEFKIFILGRTYIVGYTFGNHALWRRASGVVKLNFQPYISQMKILNTVIPKLPVIYIL